MCIICYKPGGANFPTKKQFKTMFRNNPDGAGFMTTAGDGTERVIIQKGFMEYSDLRQALAAYDEETRRARPFVFHFRIATHGGINPEMTQPFPLSDRAGALRASAYTAPVGVAHNGIIPLCMDARKMSDTAEFIRDYMTRLYDPGRGFDDITLNIIEACIESRMIILEGSGAAHMIGHGWKKAGALYFSNDSYQDRRTGKKAAKKAARLYSSWTDLEPAEDDYNTYCDGYCSTCPLQGPCWDTATASYDVGINSI